MVFFSVHEVMKYVRYNLYNYVCFCCHFHVTLCCSVASLSSCSTVDAFTNTWISHVCLHRVHFEYAYSLFLRKSRNARWLWFLEYFFCFNLSVNNVVFLFFLVFFFFFLFLINGANAQIVATEFTHVSAKQRRHQTKKWRRRCALVALSQWKRKRSSWRKREFIERISDILSCFCQYVKNVQCDVIASASLEFTGNQRDDHEFIEEKEAHKNERKKISSMMCTWCMLYLCTFFLRYFMYRMQQNLCSLVE